MLQFEPTATTPAGKRPGSTTSSLEDEGLRAAIGDHLYETLLEDVELIDGAGYDFDLEKVRHGMLSPCSSARPDTLAWSLSGELLKADHPPLPGTRPRAWVDPFDPNFSALCLNPGQHEQGPPGPHRLYPHCSGKFEKGMEVEHVQGGRKMKLSQPQQLMAQSREIIEEAYAGDIIGVFDPRRVLHWRHTVRPGEENRL